MTQLQLASSNYGALNIHFSSKAMDPNSSAFSARNDMIEPTDPSRTRPRVNQV